MNYERFCCVAAGDFYDGVCVCLSVEHLDDNLPDNDSPRRGLGSPFARAR
jgi:hypothetical protein